MDREALLSTTKELGQGIRYAAALMTTVVAISGGVKAFSQNTDAVRAETTSTTYEHVSNLEESLHDYKVYSAQAERFGLIAQVHADNRDEAIRSGLGGLASTTFLLTLPWWWRRLKEFT